MPRNANLLARKLQTIKQEVRGFNKTKLYTALMILVMSAGIFAASPLIASMANKIIRNSGIIGTILPLHVEGRYIKDAFGNIIYLRGANKPEMVDDPDGIWMDSQYWTDDNVKAELDAIRTWGVNVIRCHFSVELWKYDIGPDSGHPASPYCALSTRDAIKRLVSFAAERDLYVILDAYSVRCYWTGAQQDPLPFPHYQTSLDAEEIIANVDEFVDFWRSVASELKGYPNVIFEIWNEPTCPEAQREQGFADWLESFQLCVNAIREEGADQLIIFQWMMGVYVNLYLDDEGNTYSGSGEHLHDWLEDAIEYLDDPLGNLVYSTHFYRAYGGTGLFPREQDQAITGSYRGYSEEHINVAFDHMGFRWVGEELNKPLLIGEYGADTTRTGNEHTYETMMWDAVHKYMNTHGLHYQVYQFRSIGIFQLHYGAPQFEPYEPFGGMLIDALKSGK